MRREVLLLLLSSLLLSILSAYYSSTIIIIIISIVISIVIPTFTILFNELHNNINREQVIVNEICTKPVPDIVQASAGRASAGVSAPAVRVRPSHSECVRVGLSHSESFRVIGSEI